MKISIFAYSRQGIKTARRIADCLFNDEIAAYTVNRLCNEFFQPVTEPTAEFYGERFRDSKALIFVSSCGIAVRMTAPHIKDKQTDPAVICVDERGNFAVSLLSGHIGGANELTKRIAEQIGAAAVITTATDINDRFSPDAWAAKNGFAISEIKAAKAISAAILERDLPMQCELPISGSLPNGVFKGESGETGIYIGNKTVSPFEITLHLIPKTLHLGIGCRRKTESSVIQAVVEAVLAQNKIDKRAIKCVASIDLKQDEAGLLQFCEQNGWDVAFYFAEQLNRVNGDFSASDFVNSITGVDNVCERSAMIGADRLIVKKTAINGVTVAIAEERAVVSFE